MIKIFQITLAFMWLITAPTAFAADATKGKELYVELCISCHTIDKTERFGPGLQGVMQRRDEAWVDAWLKSPKALIEQGNSTARKLKKENAFGATMPTLPAMKDSDSRANVIAYLKTLE